MSVVIPSWNTSELTRIALEHLFASDHPLHEVIVVDNGSEDGSADMIAERFPEVRLVRNERNEGFARGCNQGMRLATGDYVFLLNTDTEVAPDAVRAMVEFLERHPEHAAVAPRLVHRSGATQRTCMAFPNWATPLWFGTPLERWFPESREMRRYFLRDWDHEDSRDVDQPPAAALVVRRSVLDQVGLFDERLWLFYNDVDLSKRIAEAGWRTHYLAEAVVLHHVGASTSKFERFLPEWHANRLVYYRKHHGRLAGVWVKACVTFTVTDHLVRNLVLRLRGREAHPLKQIAGAYVRFMAR
ncbi:MAG: glycosyltransferase family 2 protein [Planctomycetota bacterium]